MDREIRDGRKGTGNGAVRGDLRNVICQGGEVHRVYLVQTRAARDEEGMGKNE